ncbi:LOW QUALITY PROTEIN: hypothetical protein HID58_059602 [Brassica napus]|uniref:Uncharacterized protein n=1 Tax=Brassica napus TaxID=3708 RepID=A0ABQ7ZU58_BRANA|nr:LOW QUALITY PROTEIN: hypothetical protein HID58_059602 [Brassica napus]
MCTEVFQFDVSTTSGAIIPASPAANAITPASPAANAITPASPAANVSSEHKRHRHAQRKERKNLVCPFHSQDQIITSPKSTKETALANKSSPLHQWFLLVDPREGGDGDIDGMIGGPNSLSRVFVVVLVDSAKYVTYSCVLPRSGAPHLKNKQAACLWNQVVSLVITVLFPDVESE